MEFIWAKNKKINDCLAFELNIEKDCDTLVLCAVDSYQVFLDNKFVCYGPNRAPAGFVKPAVINVLGVKKLLVKVLSYGTPCYACDYQDSFFGAKLTLQNKEIYNTDDFICYRENNRLTDMPRYSRQRGYVEGYDYNIVGTEKVDTTEVISPKILHNGIDRAKYKKIDFIFDKEQCFCGFDEVKTPWWNKNPLFAPKEKDFDIVRDFFPRAINQFNSKDYHLSKEHTGFICVECNAKEPVEILISFEELLPNGEWIFARSACNDYIYLKVPAGKTEFISKEPYALKYLRVISSKEIDLDIEFITYENDFDSCIKVSGNKDIENVFDAAINTFRQNAVDLFTDRPGRERAGWLCDSYFSAKAEQLFTGRNEIEKDFLLNYLLAETPEIPVGMLPMCFPSEHTKNTHIPNWAMWFIVELHDYFTRTGDKNLISMAKEKVYGIINYLDGYVNEIGLLEDLKGWVFVEWSVCNSPDYVKGINFPSNMMYAYALQKAGELFNNDKFIDRSKMMREQIVELSFDGNFFADNAIREDGKIIRCDNHLTETCQYYALFTGLCPNKDYAEKIVNDFGPFRIDNNIDIAKSNMFIGNYLRLFWLCDIGEYNRVLDESVEYFRLMADKTGTLWEHDSPKASCCHGFASVIAVIMSRCICGYVGVKNHQPLIDNRHKISDKYKLKINFNY